MSKQFKREYTEQFTISIRVIAPDFFKKYKPWTVRSNCCKIAFIVWTNVYHLDKHKIDEIKSLLCECYRWAKNFLFCDYQVASAVW